MAKKKKGSGVALWGSLTGVTAVLTAGAVVGNVIANQYATTLNLSLIHI